MQVGRLSEFPDRCLVRELLRNDDPSFDEAIKLYEESFPEDEREPTPAVRRRVSRRLNASTVTDCLPRFLICEKKGEILGIDIHDYYPGTGLGWLVYIATSPNARRQGVGSLLYRSAVQSCLQEATFVGDKFRGVILEVERVSDARTAEEREEREQRLEFFAQHGVLELTHTYVQPALAEGLNPVPLSLYLAGIDQPLDTSTKRSIVNDFMVLLWRMKEDDQAVRQAVGGVC